MHYKNGRQAQVGDKIVGKDWAGCPISGVVIATIPGNGSCNLTIVPTQPQQTLTAQECLHIDDVLPPTGK